MSPWMMTGMRLSIVQMNGYLSPFGEAEAARHRVELLFSLAVNFRCAQGPKANELRAA